MKYTNAEENYLKAIYKHSEKGTNVSTNTLSQELGTTPASVTDMIKKLSEKNLVEYLPYRGVTLTENGKKIALATIRKHRLWEVFLVEKLKFTWDEVHETAEQLEHIESEKLINKLDEFLGFPKFDPHGDPIPNEQGEIAVKETVILANVLPGSQVVVSGVLEHSPDFLRYLNRLQFSIGRNLRILELIPFDKSLLILMDEREVIISSAITQNVLVEIIS